MSPQKILVAIALVCFILATVGLGLGVNMIALGLVFWSAAHLV